MIKKWSKYLISSHLLSTIRPLLTMTFFLGLTPIRDVKNANHLGMRNLILCPFGIFIAFAILTTYVTVYSVSLYRNESFVGYFFKSNISMIGDALQTVTGFLGIGLIYVTSISQQDKLVKLLFKISDCGERLEELGIKVLYKKTRSYFYLAFLIVHLINLSYVFGSFMLAKLFMNGENPAVYIMIGFFLQYTIVSTSIISFLCTSNIIKRRFIFVNSILNKLTLKVPNSEKDGDINSKTRRLCFKSFCHTISNKLPVEIIQESMDVHSLLCDATDTANKYFTYQLLTIISISFLIIVFDAYYILQTCLTKIKNGENFKSIEFVTFFLCQMILYILAIISIVEGSVKIVKNSEKTSGIVHYLLNRATDSEIKEKLQNFSLQLIHQKIEFTAAGLFNIDRSLYFTITGAMTTYLIILLQFSL